MMAVESRYRGYTRAPSPCGALSLSSAPTDLGPCPDLVRSSRVCVCVAQQQQLQQQQQLVEHGPQPHVFTAITATDDEPSHCRSRWHDTAGTWWRGAVASFSTSGNDISSSGSSSINSSRSSRASGDAGAQTRHFGRTDAMGSRR